MLDLSPLLKLYARYRTGSLNRVNCAQVQQQQLLKLVTRAKDTRFGIDHSFSKIRSVADYQKQVPLRVYEEFWSSYWKDSFPRIQNSTWPGLIPFFAVSSGTSSGRTKYIPLTKEMVRSNTIAGLDLLVHHVTNRPSSRIAGGKSFMLGGSTDLVEQSPGIFSGDLSGIAVKTLPWWAAIRYFPPQKLALIKDWEEKIAILAQESLRQDIRMISGVPSWMLIFFKKLWQLKPNTHGGLAAYPNLEMLVHGGVNFSPYLSQFKEILRGTNTDIREVYPASEGFIAVADRGSGEGMRVVLDHGIFFEFVPVAELGTANPTRHWIGSIEPEVNYAIVLSTCAGLWSYVLGDTVRFTDAKTPRLLVTGRTSYFLSAFGEHLTGEEVESAVAEGARVIGEVLSDFSVGALYPEKSGDLGGHLIVAEFEKGIPAPAMIETFATTIDKRLSELNEDYEAHRASGFGLNSPKILAVPSGSFARWMKSRGKLGGQHKVPRIITDADLFKDLRRFMG